MKKPKKHNQPEKEITEVKIKQLLAEHIGVDVDDINEDDSLYEDLHMTASDLSEFVELLNTQGHDTSLIQLEEIDTVSDLIESISSEELE